VPARLRPVGTPRARPELLPAGLGARAAGLRPRVADWPLVPPGPVVAEWPRVLRGALAPRRTGIPAWPAVAEPPVPAEVALAAVPVVRAAVIAVPAVTVPVIARCPATATGLAARAG
jgi:hypothetical protein